MFKYTQYISSIVIFVCIFSCSSIQDKDAVISKTDHKKYLNPDEETEEVFRILLSSDKYIVSQLKFKELISRTEDKSGDRFMKNEVNKHDKIDEIREGIISVWLYPDTGRIMRIRPKKSTYLVEVDKLINDDLQRWNFKFPQKIVDPTNFDIRYRVVLQKKKSDEEIIKEVQDKMKERQ